MIEMYFHTVLKYFCFQKVLIYPIIVWNYNSARVAWNIQRHLWLEKSTIQLKHFEIEIEYDNSKF